MCCGCGAKLVFNVDLSIRLMTALEDAEVAKKAPKLARLLDEAQSLIKERRRFTPMKYKIGPDGKSITCVDCGSVSHNENDVRYRYCGTCKKFHDT